MLRIRPLLLHRVTADFFEGPGTNITDLAVHVVIPARSRHGIRDRFTQFVRTGAGEGVVRRHFAKTAAAGRVGHDRVEDFSDRVVITAKVLTGLRTTQDRYNAGFEKNEVQTVARIFRDGLRLDPLQELRTHGAVGDTAAWRRVGAHRTAEILPMTQRLTRDVVFRQLI